MTLMEQFKASVYYRDMSNLQKAIVCKFNDLEELYGDVTKKFLDGPFNPDMGIVGFNIQTFIRKICKNKMGEEK